MKIYDAPHNFARVEEHDICPTLIARAGTGGGNVPLVLGSAQANAAILDDDTCPTLTAQMGTGGNNMPLVLMDQGGNRMDIIDDAVGTLRSLGHVPLVLMDQGGGVMSVEHDKVGTLRAQTHGHEPLVLDPYNFKEDDKCFTLRAGISHSTNTPMTVQAVHENQLCELRLSEVSPPLQTPSGKAGRGLPVVLQEAFVYDPPHNFGNMREHTTSPTLLAAMGEGRNNTPLVLSKQEVFRISSDASNCMRSANPLTGFKQTDLSPTLDTVDPSPSKAQGGLAIVVAENVIGRSENNGPQGKGWTEDKCFTLNSTGVHAVLPPVPHCFKLRSGKEGGGKGYLGQDDKTFTLATTIDQFLMTNEPMPINTQVVQGRPSDNGRMGSGIGKPGDPANTLQANHSHGVFDMQARVRKLTPTECERLQGFPDGWTKIPFRGKDAENCPDSPRYKAIGNSWAVPCVRWIGERIDKEVKK